MINLPFFHYKKKFKVKPCTLLILDGFGVAPPSTGNAITLAKTPNINRLLNSYPHSTLIASGESVGLPANEVGNTEVGHLTLGAGKVIFQDLKRVNLAIEKGYFYDNKAFLMATNHVKNNSSRLHIFGLVSSGKVHSSIDHLYALLQFCKKEDIKDVYLHIFTDGRDAPPNEGIEVVNQLETHINNVVRIGKIASVTGRYYAMDRDRRWDRTQKTYDALVMGQGKYANSPVEAVKNSYDSGKTDEFIEPTLIKEKDGSIVTVEDNDAVIFFNYRVDRPKQLTMAFVMSDFEKLRTTEFDLYSQTYKVTDQSIVGTTFLRKKVLKNIFFVTLTEYHKNLPVSGVAFPPEIVELPLARVISECGLKQIHMAESEKERFVNYYFDGLREKPFSGEETQIVASPRVPTYDNKPEMSLPSLSRMFRYQMTRDVYHFAVINFANPDMVAHTGNLQATIKAIEVVDKYIVDMERTILSQDGTLIVTADHGNAEELLSFPNTTYFYTSANGTVNTDHSNNPVPVIVCNRRLLGKNVILDSGSLADVAPTILKVMNLQKPDTMTGKDLLAKIS